MRDRRIACGTDIRQYGPSPEDHARAEALVARHGGSVELYGLAAGCAVRWVEGNIHVTEVAATYADALAHVSRRIQA